MPPATYAADPDSFMDDIPSNAPPVYNDLLDSNTNVPMPPPMTPGTAIHNDIEDIENVTLDTPGFSSLEIDSSNYNSSSFPLDPPSDLPDNFAGFSDSPRKSSSTPPTRSFPRKTYLDHDSMALGVSPIRAARYSDNPDGGYRDVPLPGRQDMDEEGRSVWTHGASTDGGKSGIGGYHRKTISMCLLGFIMGTIVMIAFVLLTGAVDRSASGGDGVGRLGAPDEGLVELANPNPNNAAVENAKPVLDHEDKDELSDIDIADIKDELESNEDMDAHINVEDHVDSTLHEHEDGDDASEENQDEQDEGEEAASEDETATKEDSGIDVTVKVQEPGEDEAGAADEENKDTVDTTDADDVSDGDIADAGTEDGETATVEEGEGDDNQEESPSEAEEDVTNAEVEVDTNAENSPNNDEADVKDNAEPDPTPPAPVPEAKQPAPQPTPVSNPRTAAPVNPSNVIDSTNSNKKVDISVSWCGDCMWKGSGYSCTDRVGYLLDHFSLTEGEAKTNLMKQGHCPESRVVGYIGAVQTSQGPKEPSPIGDMFSCRQKPKPGENSFDNFCGHCVWKGSKYSCFQRVKFLTATYGTPELVGAQGLMDQGHCKDDYTPEQLAKQKEQGIDLWCGGCQLRRDHSCDADVNFATGFNEEKEIAMKKDMISKGLCKMPPFCE